MAEDKGKQREEKLADPGKAPLKNADTDVTIVPKRGVSARDKYCEKVDESVRRDVHKTITKHKDAPSKDVIEKVKETVKEAAKKVDHQKVERVIVHVDGEAGGRPVKEKISVPVPDPAQHGPKKADD